MHNFVFQAEDSEQEDLITGEVDAASDTTDSEHEDETEVPSDHERDVSSLCSCLVKDLLFVNSERFRINGTEPVII